MDVRLPTYYLCELHWLDSWKGLKWPLYRQIEEIRRSNCDCNLDRLYQWYDLIGQYESKQADSDLLNPQNQ